MDVRPSPIAGRWYPAHPARLARDVDRYLADATPEVPPGTIWAVLAPHAGLHYSGPVAAWAFACLQRRLARSNHTNATPQRAFTSDAGSTIVALVGPMHYPAPARLLTTAHDAYATPLGDIVVDADAVRQLDAALRQRSADGLARVRGDREHALELELPFLQRVLGTFRLLPVMVRDQRAATAKALGHALAEVLRGRQVLLVASSDLSHYYPHAVAQELDADLLDRLAAFDPAGVLAHTIAVERGACGGAALAAVLWAARDLGADRVTVMRYATSGDVTGDFEAVVGYGAAAVWQSAV